jgi:hypothetical protein
VHRRSSALASVLAISSVLALNGAGCSSSSSSAPAGLTATRGGPAQTQSFTASAPGEALMSVTASAPGVSWQQAGAESAVASLAVDGRYVTDLVVPSADPLPRSLALGPVSAGTHTLSVTFAADRSAAPATALRLDGIEVRVLGSADPGFVAASHAPVLIGRVLPDYGGPFQNARTDTPLVAWHEDQAAADSHRVLEYSLVWSNEDGGTSPPALMAQWGRTTDIEWIYRVEVDGAGRAVPGTAVYQAPKHQTLPFRGRYEDQHPVLQTCTANNDVCDRAAGPMRFFLDAEQTKPADRAREVLMDTNPWTYPVMAQEMIREGKIENPSNPATPGVGDQRTYLYLELGKTTGPAAHPGLAPGLAVGVQLKGSSKVYRSDHSAPLWSINRDGAVATTVELPAGTTPADIDKVLVIRQPILADTGSPVTVTAVNRGFFLTPGYLPADSFLHWTGTLTLTPQHPQATLIG